MDKGPWSVLPHNVTGNCRAFCFYGCCAHLFIHIFGVCMHPIFWQICGERKPSKISPSWWESLMRCFGTHSVNIMRENYMQDNLTCHWCAISARILAAFQSALKKQEMLCTTFCFVISLISIQIPGKRVKINVISVWSFESSIESSSHFYARILK